MRKVLNDVEFFAHLSELFVQEGASTLTVSDIASRLRCSRRRLYDIAATKDDLFCLVVRRFLAGVLEEAETWISRAQDPKEALAAYLDIGVRAAGRVSAAFLRDVDALEPARAAFDDYQRLRAARLCQLIDEGVKQGVFVKCHGQVVSEIVLGAAMRLRTHAFLTQSNLTIEEAFQELYRVLLGGLLSERHKHRSSRIGIESHVA